MIARPPTGTIHGPAATRRSRAATRPPSVDAWSLSTRGRYPLSLRAMSTEAWGEPRARAGGLAVWLRAPSGAPPAAGGGSAIFVHGAATHEGRPVRRIDLAAGGAPVPAMAAGMPSPTLAAELGSPAAARSIFWGVVPIAATGPAAPELELVARLDGGGEARVALGPVAGEAPARSHCPGRGEHRDLHGDLRAAAPSCSSASSSRCAPRPARTGSA